MVTVNDVRRFRTLRLLPFLPSAPSPDLSKAPAGAIWEIVRNALLPPLSQNLYRVSPEVRWEIIKTNVVALMAPKARHKTTDPKTGLCVATASTPSLSRQEGKPEEIFTKDLVAQQSTRRIGRFAAYALSNRNNH